jgi:hypothetical protein
MRHPNDGTLRRLVDEPAGVADADREHVAGCPVCLAGLAAARDDAEVAGAALDVEIAADVDEGYRRLARSVAERASRGGATLPSAHRFRAALRSPALAVAGAVVVLTGAGAAGASDWLQIFRTEQVTPLTLTDEDLLRLPDLSAYGHVDLSGRPGTHVVPDADAAEEATGLSVPDVAGLPEGVKGPPVFRVGDRLHANFTFSADRARRAADAVGETLPPPPAGMDGAKFRLVAGPGVAEIWSSTHGVPALLVARAVAPTGYSTGVPLQTALDYLVSLPGISDDVAAELRALGDGSTLPLPLPAGTVTGSADVGGERATVFTSPDGAISGVVWADDGIVTAVAGSVSVDEVLAVARGLR